MDYRLTQTGVEVQDILNQAPVEITTSQLDTLITDADEGWYLVPLDSGGSMLVQVVMDGPVVYQVGLTEPHSGRIMLRHYNTQAPTPAWTEWVDAYVDKLTAADIAFGHVSDSGMKITINGVEHIVSQTSQPLGSSNAFVAPTWEALTIALEAKQDVISDLSTIRSGAAAGATAVQPATLESELAGKQNTLTFDSTPTANSSNPVTSAGIKTYVDNHSSDITVDDTLSTTSENPVQNKVVTGALNGKQATIDDLSTIRSGAAAGATAVQPSTLQSELAGKQDTLTFDNTPTANSNNPVKSGGVKTAIDAKQDTISTVNVTVDNNTGTPSGSASVSGSTLSLSFQNLKGATGAQGPQGIQGVQGPQGPKGDTGVTGDASSLAIIHGIDKTSTYTTTDVCGADAAQALLNEIEGGFYY